MAVFVGLRSRFLVYTVLASLSLYGQSRGQSVTPAPALPADAPQGQFVNRVLTDENGDHKYVVFVPANYTPDKKWPVILFLHGACNRGTDGRSQLVSGLAPSIRLRMAEYPFLVVFPQCEDTRSRVLGGWTDQPDDSARALKMLDNVEKDYSVDTKRECLVGLSMGGTGVWEIASRTQDRWAALVPVSAMSSTDLAPKLSKARAWVFHATSDPLVSPHIAKNMVAAVNSAGGKAYFTEVSKRAHDLSNVVFTQTALTDWLLDPSKEPNQDLTWVEPKGYNNGHELELPYVPGAEMARAVRFRICKDMLEALCFSAPAKLAEKPVSGYVGGVHQSTRLGGILPIDVALSGLKYYGHLERVKVTPMAPNRLIVQAALRNVTMTVSNSQLSGKVLLSASAGPMNIVIGHRAPVWVTLELQPYVENRQIHLNLSNMDFKIPSDNWYVTEPSGVHVRGLPFLNGRVSDGLVEGVYSRKGEIERQVLNAIPPMVQNLEKKLNEAMLSKITCIGQIAMPIWQPRMKTFPEEILIDDAGITIVSSVMLGTLGQVPKDFKMRTYEALTEFPPPIKTGMEIDIAETVVPAWSELIMTGGVNRFNVFDFTPKEYHDLADRQFLQEIIPDLKRFGDELECNVDFLLAKPIRLLEPPADAPKPLESVPGNMLTLSVQSVPLNVAMRRKGEIRWKPVGQLDLHIDREYGPYVYKNGFAKRGPKFMEIGKFRIKSKWSFDPAYQPENAEVDEARFVATVLKAREAAQLLEGVKPDAVHDVVLNGVPLRMDAMDFVKKHLVVQYQLPGVLVTNDSNADLVYEVRGPLTDWSKPRTLAPGESDEYRVPYSLTWRRRMENQAQLYTLPLGKEGSFRVDPVPNMVLVNHAEELAEERIVPQ